MRELYPDDAAQLLCPFGTTEKACLSRRCMGWEDTGDGQGYCRMASDIRYVRTEPENALAVEICEV